MRIVIETIPHESQRYCTVGDFFEDADGTLHIRVSEMGNDDYAFLIAIHELTEAYLCKRRAVAFSEIDAFDMSYEEARPKGDLSEPGDDPRAPYRDQHCFATAVERMACAALGISWKKYEDAVNEVS